MFGINDIDGGSDRYDGTDDVSDSGINSNTNRNNDSENTLFENDHLVHSSPEKDCGWRLTFRQPVRKPSSESSDRF